MSLDDLTHDEELALASAADEMENSLLATGDSAESVKEQDEQTTGSNAEAVREQDEQTQAVMGNADASNLSSKFTLAFEKGDLFTCPASDSLAHCVSKDLRMGKGIAVLFKQKFGGLTELRKQAQKVGDVAILNQDGRFIYYLITKPMYNNKPTYQSLQTTLLGMKHHCVRNGVTRLSMPRIGCGLDRLEWTEVEKILRKVFCDTDMVITIYSL